MLVSLAFTAMLVGHTAPAETRPTLAHLDFQIVEASLFKNGYAVIAREADVPASGSYELDDLPSLSLGTVWISATPGTTIESVVRTSEFRPGTFKVGGFEALISANVGKTVTLTRSNLPTVTGKIAADLGQVVLLEANGQQQVVAKNSVTGISTKDKLVTTAKTGSARQILKFRVKAGPGARIRLMGLEAGLSWTPAYSLDITDNDRLNLVQRATITNDIGTISAKMVKLTTGFPNLPYAASIDPLFANAQVFRGGGMGGGGFGGQMANQAPATEQMPIAATSGQMNEDMFFYRLPVVTLEKDDRGYYVIQDIKCPYEHVYTWEVGNPDVWHSISFTNGNSSPLTTGVGTTYKNGEILGQDQLNYTPAGGTGLLRITKAMDVTTKAIENEVSSEKLTLKYSDAVQVPFNLATIKGTLVVKNSKDYAIRMKVTKALVGEITEIDKDAIVTKSVRNARDFNQPYQDDWVNPRSNIEWSPKLGPGETKTLEYTYKAYFHI